MEREEEQLMIQKFKRGDSWKDPESAQAGIIYTYIVGIAMAIAVYIYTTPVVDEFTIFHNQYTQGANPMYPISQNLQDSIFFTQIGIHDWVIVFLVIWTIAAYAAALKYRSQVV